MALTRIKTNQITDLAVTTAKIANKNVTAGKLEDNLTYGSNFTVSGNLTVSGTTTSVSTTNTRVEDAIIALSAEATGSASVDSGLLINRGSDDNQAFLWDESADQFILANVGSEDGDTAGNVTVSSYAGLQAGAIVYASLNDGTTTLTATAAELNALDGITADVNELNILDGVTATAAELNALDGITSSTAELNILTGVTADATEINTLDGITSSTAELNILTGVTSTAAEINLVDGSIASTIVNGKAVIYGSGGEVNATALQVGGVAITSTPAELNILDGATLDVNELNILDGVTSTAAELNLVDGSVAGTVINNKAVVYGAGGEVNATALQVGGVSITSTPAELNILDGATLDVNELNLLDGVTATTTELNILDGVTATTAEINFVDGVTSNVQTQINSKLALAGGTMSGAIAMGTNAITNMADPTNQQDAATKAYVDGEVSSASSLTISDGSATDSVIVGTNTLTFAGTANEITTAVTDNQLQIGLASDVSISNDLTVAGNLTVQGTTTTLSTTNSVVSDSLIELNTGVTSNANDLGLIFERGSTGDNAVFAWDESADKFTLGTTTATGASTGDLTITAGTLVAALEGNADTATALETARTIAVAGDVVGSASFDGTGNISISTTIQADSVALGTDTTGNYVESLVGGNGITAGAAAEGGTPSIAVDLTDTAIFATDGTASRAVVLDGSGDFSANMITSDLTGNVTGNADTATALATPRAIEVSGAVTGTANFDGSAAINIVTTNTADPTITLAGDLTGSVTLTDLGDGTLTATVAPNSVALGTDTTGNYMSDTTGGNGITVTHTPAEGSSAAIAVDLTDTAIFASDGTASRAVVLDASGNFTANAITTTNIDGILGANTAAAATVTTLNASSLASLDGGIDVDGAFVVADTSGNITTTGTAIIGSASATAGATLKVDGTDSMMLPVGTTGQRPASPATGMFRYNSTLNQIEYYDNTGWESVSTAFTLASSQTFNGDDTTTAFTLSALTGADSYTVAGVLVMLNGVVQEPTTVYGISGQTLTFTTAPATGDLIEVRKFTTTTTVVAVADSDGDTQVQVEETSDDDTIRFDVQGTEKAYLNSTGLVVGGNIHATGNITSDGDITLGDQSSDTVTFTAKVGSNIVPTADSTYDLGSDPASSGQAWANVYADTYYGDGSNLTGIDATQILNGTSNVQVASNADITVTRGGTLSATFTAAGMTGDVTGDVTGNADTATALETARAIQVSGAVTGTANFDGTSGINIVTTNTADPTLTLAGDLSGSATFTNLGNATLTATIAANSVALGTDTTGNYVGTGATSGNGISGSVSSEGGTFTVSSNATSSNSGNTIVFRDGSGNFSAGTVTATATSAQYADLAEMYAADEEIAPGTVVHFAGDGKVAACDIENCRAVAGIISTDPAHLMNSAQEGVALALAGRVPCKVTGPVAAGDLMVSAGNGMAMANNDAAMGTVIGKAIEAHEGGEGVIEVLALMM